MAFIPKPFEKPVYVTKPLVPPISEFQQRLGVIWESGQFTNGGLCHAELEARLGTHLGAPHISLFNNGTIALVTACRALRLSGEVITTPFTFPATPHVLSWNNVTPVFADIDSETLTIDPARVARLVTPRTTGILGVHVYGMPCDVHGLQRVADEYGLKVLYDGAHAFGTTVDGQPVARYGDATMFSFHATKLFHTAEGGALTVSDATLKQRIDLLKNFGIRGETDVVMPGINGKMSELQAALGLVVLDHVENERQNRAIVARIYDERICDLPGLRIFRPPNHVRNSLQYYVIRVDSSVAPINREQLYSRLRDYNVYSRRYFFPLCSEYSCYRSHPSANSDNLPVATRVATEVLALPFYGDLGVENTVRVCDIIDHILRNP